VFVDIEDIELRWKKSHLANYAQTELTDKQTAAKVYNRSFSHCHSASHYPCRRRSR